MTAETTNSGAYLPVEAEQTVYSRTLNPGSDLMSSTTIGTRHLSVDSLLLTSSDDTATNAGSVSDIVDDARTEAGHNSHLSFQEQNEFGRAAIEAKNVAETSTKRSNPILSWWWWWEIGGTILSLVSVGLIIVVLKRVDDHSVDQWPYSIRPNSMIAVLTTITKAAMMVPITSCLSQLKWGHFQNRPNPLHHLGLYDDASRGPWGCFLILLTWRLKAVTAWALALVTLVALGIEPSAQQMLEQQSRPAPLRNATVEIGRAGNYTSKAIWSGSINGYGGPRDPNPDLLTLQTTIANGAVGTIQEVNFKCPEPSEKCVWGQFDTLAVCATFKNVTDTVNRTCHSNTYNDTCTFQFPQESSIDMVSYGIAGGTSLFNTTMAWNNIDGVLQGVLNGVNDTNPDYDAPFTNAEAFTITLDWCVRNYHSVVASPAGIHEANYTTSPLLLYNLTPTVAAPDAYYSYDYYHTPSSSELYNISVSLRTGLFGYVNRLFSRQLTSPLTEDSADADFSFGEFMYYTDLVNFTKNIQDTLTNQIGSTAPGDNRDALMFPGQAFYQEPFWHVYWPWIILPVTEVVLTAVLLCVSIVLTRHQPLFKSSSLALLYHPLDRSEEDERVGDVRDSISGLEKAAKGVRVEFRESEDGVLKFYPVQGQERG
ncbi:hypothetical protein M426DRAFT_21116 [Hypoxylon sp. CI-4A]|nr:hypothetical protein M426DRAFT_21116 [Hypoxylon sp. CI-4A]